MKINYGKNKNGISLVALVVTIIILLILGGITFMIVNHLIMDKAVAASAKTMESALLEKVEMAWMEAKASDLMNTEKSEKFQEAFVKNLKEVYQFENITILESENSVTKFTFIYQNQEFSFNVSSDGKASISAVHKIEDGTNVSKPLKGNVKIGDYVEYPIEYMDIYSEKQYTSTNGWRVIDDGIMEGTSGCVRIISTAIPAKWEYDPAIYENNEVAVNELLNHFEDITVVVGNLTNGAKIKGNKFKDEKFASKISTLTLADLNQIYNHVYQTNRKLNDTSLLNNDEHELFYFRNYKMFYYWLATIEENTNNIYTISDVNIQSEKAKSRLGIRPVIYLKEGLNGKLENNVWKIIN